MEIQDFAEPEIAITAAVAAAIFSPRARKVARKGLVYGMAGILAAGDAVNTFAHSVGQGIQQASHAQSPSVQETKEPEGQQFQAMQTGKEPEGQHIQAMEIGKEPESSAAARRKTPKPDATKIEEKAGGE
jgi:hypothetical protein